MLSLSGAAGYCLRRVERFTGFFIDRYPPEIHAPAAIAGKVEEVSARVPHGIPVDGSVIRDGLRVRAVRTYGPKISLTAFVCPVGNAVLVGRPSRLYAVFDIKRPALAGRDINDE